MAKSQVIIGVKGEVNLQDLDRGIAKLQAMKAEAGGTSTQFTKFGDSLLKVGGILAATFAVSKVADFFQESIRGAMEDEKSLVALAKAMENVGLAQKNAAAEDLIKSMSLQFGIADDQLRPAFQRLVTATRDVERSQKLLGLALDISAAGYADTESAAKALSAAAMGNFTALQRLKLPIDANTVATKDFEGAITQLNQSVGGQAAAAAETYQGKLNRVTVAANEAKEAIGYALLSSIDNVSKAFGGTDGATSAITSFGDQAADLISGLGVLAAKIAELAPPANDAANSTKRMSDQYKSFWEAFNKNSVSGAAPIQGLVAGIQYLGDSFQVAQESADASANGLRSWRTAAANAARGASGSVGPINDMTDGLAEVAAAAYEAAGGYMAFFEAVVNKQRVQRDLANTSGTVSSAILEGVTKGADLTEAKLAEIRDKINKAASGGGRGGSGQSSAQSAQDAASKATDAMKQRLEQLKSYAEQAGKAVTGFLSIDAAFTAFSDRQKAASDAYAALIEAQKQLGENATQAEKDRVAELQTVYDNAKAAASKGAQDIVGEFVARAEKAKEFGEKLKILLANNLNKQTFDEIAGMSAERGVEVANAFINGNISQNIARVNSAVASAKQVADQVGVQAASTFKDVGEGLAQGMMAALAAIIKPGSKQAKAIGSLMDSFAASLNRVSTVDVITRRYELGQPPPAVPSSGINYAAQVEAVAGVSPNQYISDADFNQAFDNLNAWAAGTWTPMAVGGIVTAPTPIIAGEAGPEAIIPLSRAGSLMSGDTNYHITVQAGVGDPRQIGEQIVTYIKRFEQSSGQVFASA